MPQKTIMIKSLAITALVCCLNSSNFNIQPKEVVNQYETTLKGTYTSNQTYTKTELIGGEQQREIYIYTKNIYKIENNFITKEIQDITRYAIIINLDATYQHATSIENISKSINRYETYTLFNAGNTNIDNIYINDVYFSNFSDTKRTTYNFAFQDQNATKRYIRYDYTNETETNITNLKNANTADSIQNALNQLDRSINFNTTSTDWMEGTTITLTTKEVEVQTDKEQLEQGYKITTRQIISTTSNLTLTYEGQLLDTEEKLDNWYQQFYTIIEGVNTWTYNATSTSQEKVNNKFYLSVDTQGQTTPEVIDLGGLMWDIIGMPFTFIAQAFNVTLFPGTMYEFNIATLFKGMIAILAILFIVKLFTRGIDVLGAYTGSAQNAKYNRENQQMKREKHQMDKEKHAKDMSKKE